MLAIDSIDSFVNNDPLWLRADILRICFRGSKKKAIFSSYGYRSLPISGIRVSKITHITGEIVLEF